MAEQHGPARRARSRRGHGEGTISKRRDGRWEARVDLGWFDGKRVRRTFYGVTRAEAAEKLRKALELVKGQAQIPGAQLRLGDFLDRWLEDVIKPTRQRSTWSGYEVNVRRHIKPTLGHVRLAKLTPAQVQSLITSKLDEGLSPRTVQYIHATLRAALSTAVRWGLVVRNVALPVRTATVDRAPVRPFSRDEAHQVLEAAAHRLGAFFTVAMAVGLRPSEALALTWDDLDLEARLVHVRRSLDRRRSDDFQFKPTKSRRSRRTIPLPGICVQALLQHRRRQAQERLASRSEWKDHNLVFTTKTGGPLDRTQVSRQFTECSRWQGSSTAGSTTAGTPRPASSSLRVWLPESSWRLWAIPTTR
jgi:integrase